MTDDALKQALLRKARESRDTQQAFFDDNGDRLIATVRALAAAIDRGGRVYTFGNGGSACDAQHTAVEFAHPVVEKRPAIAAIALSADTALLSAVANDQDFALAFAQQLRLLGRAGDVAIGFSTSGRSASVVRAFRAAREVGMLTIGLGGRDGGQLHDVCDHPLIVRSWSIHRIQEVHQVVLHTLWDLVHVARGADDVL